MGGDLGLTVDKGRTVKITLEDLRAFDPDDKATDLIFSVSNARNGFVSLSRKPAEPVAKFSQAELQSGIVLFHHDGTNTQKASFDVVVADQAGATSGSARTVQVDVLHAQRAALHQSKSAAVHERGHHASWDVKMAQHSLYFPAGQHDR